MPAAFSPTRPGGPMGAAYAERYDYDGVSGQTLASIAVYDAAHTVTGSGLLYLGVECRQVTAALRRRLFRY